MLQVSIGETVTQMMLTPWRLWQSAELARLHDTPCDKTGPSSLMGSSQTSTFVSVEELHISQKQSSP